MMRKRIVLVAALAVALIGSGALPTGGALAQQGAASQTRAQARPSATNEDQLLLRGQTRYDVNTGAVGIVTARTPTGTLTQATVDLSTLLDDGEYFEKLRVVPIISRGKMQNLWDILYLRGVDVGFLQTDTLEFIKSDPQVATIKSRIRYIASMFPEEIHIIARPEIRSLQDLAGKPVSVNAKGTGSAMTLPIIFQRLGIKAVLEHEDPNVAVERMRRGELMAHTFVFGKPTQSVANIRGEGFHLLSVPYTPELADLYLPAKLTAKDYPNLIPPDQEIDTVAVGNVLAVFNWPEESDRYKKVARFTEAFFTKFQDLHKPGFHTKWKEVNLAASVPGWTRFKAAQDWLDRAGRAQSAADAGRNSSPDESGLREEFNGFLKQHGPSRNTRNRDELFQQFLDWRKTRL